MYVKMIDDTLNIANMPDDEAIEKGYKLAVFAEKPIAEEGYHAESAWTETADSYVQSWSIVQDEDDPEPSDEDYATAGRILMGVES